MLKASNLSFSYRDALPVLQDVSVSVQAGEILALLGPSGCGKSTLLRLLAGLEECASGNVVKANDASISYVFQDDALMPWATVEGNILLPLKITGYQNQADIQKLLRDVGLEGLGSRFPNELSGGQKMRVSLARALSTQPDIILLDEPFAALDEILRFQMNETLLALRNEHNLSCVFVTHSIYEAAYLADRILVMRDGRISGEIKPALDRRRPAQEQRASAPFLAAAEAVSAMLVGETA